MVGMQQIKPERKYWRSRLDGLQPARFGEGIMKRLIPTAGPIVSDAPIDERFNRIGRDFAETRPRGRHAGGQHPAFQR